MKKRELNRQLWVVSLATALTALTALTACNQSDSADPASTSATDAAATDPAATGAVASVGGAVATVAPTLDLASIVATLNLGGTSGGAALVDETLTATVTPYVEKPDGSYEADTANTKTYEITPAADGTGTLAADIPADEPVTIEVKNAGVGTFIGAVAKGEKFSAPMTEEMLTMKAVFEANAASPDANKDWKVPLYDVYSGILGGIPADDKDAIAAAAANIHSAFKAAKEGLGLDDAAFLAYAKQGADDFGANDWAASVATNEGFSNAVSKVTKGAKEAFAAKHTDVTLPDVDPTQAAYAAFIPKDGKLADLKDVIGAAVANRALLANVDPADFKDADKLAALKVTLGDAVALVKAQFAANKDLPPADLFKTATTGISGVIDAAHNSKTLTPSAVSEQVAKSKDDFANKDLNNAKAVSDAQAAKDGTARPANGYTLAELCLGAPTPGQMVGGKCTGNSVTTTTTTVSLMADCQKLGGTYHEGTCTLADASVKAQGDICVAAGGVQNQSTHQCDHTSQTSATQAMEIGGLCALMQGSRSADGKFCVLPNGLPKAD